MLCKTTSIWSKWVDSITWLNLFGLTSLVIDQSLAMIYTKKPFKRIFNWNATLGVHAVETKFRIFTVQWEFLEKPYRVIPWGHESIHHCSPFSHRTFCKIIAHKLLDSPHLRCLGLNISEVLLFIVHRSLSPLPPVNEVLPRCISWEIWKGTTTLHPNRWQSHIPQII